LQQYIGDYLLYPYSCKLHYDPSIHAGSRWQSVKSARRTIDAMTWSWTIAAVLRHCMAN
jgi:hypothetical protein